MLIMIKREAGAFTYTNGASLCKESGKSLGLSLLGVSSYVTLSGLGFVKLEMKTWFLNYENGCLKKISSGPFWRSLFSKAHCNYSSFRKVICASQCYCCTLLTFTLYRTCGLKFHYILLDLYLLSHIITLSKILSVPNCMLRYAVVFQWVDWSGRP